MLSVAASGPCGRQSCKPVVARGPWMPHGRSRGLLDKVNL
jgi:hypothetical protein